MDTVFTDDINSFSHASSISQFQETISWKELYRSMPQAEQIVHITITISTWVCKWFEAPEFSHMVMFLAQNFPRTKIFPSSLSSVLRLQFQTPVEPTN